MTSTTPLSSMTTGITMNGRQAATILVNNLGNYSSALSGTTQASGTDTLFSQQSLQKILNDPTQFSSDLVNAAKYFMNNTDQFKLLESDASSANEKNNVFDNNDLQSYINDSKSANSETENMTGIATPTSPLTFTGQVVKVYGSLLDPGTIANLADEVKQDYRDILGRNADQDGLNYYVLCLERRMQNGSFNTAEADIRALIASSAEKQQNSAAINAGLTAEAAPSTPIVKADQMTSLQAATIMKNDFNTLDEGYSLASGDIQGAKDDGCIGNGDIEAVLAHPDLFDPQLVQALTYLNDNPTIMANYGNPFGSSTGGIDLNTINKFITDNTASATTTTANTIPVTTTTTTTTPAATPTTAPTMTPTATSSLPSSIGSFISVAQVAKSAALALNTAPIRVSNRDGSYNLFIQNSQGQTLCSEMFNSSGKETEAAYYNNGVSVLTDTYNSDGSYDEYALNNGQCVQSSMYSSAGKETEAAYYNNGVNVLTDVYNSDGSYYEYSYTNGQASSPKHYDANGNPIA